MTNILSNPGTNTFEGVLLTLISLSALLFILPVKNKTSATRLLMTFFVCMALLGSSRILEGTIGGTVFTLLQDSFISLGGLFLVQFAYRFPKYDQPGEARAALILYSCIVALSFGTVLDLGVEASRFPNVYISVSEYFWYLMPFSIVLAVFLCLRRAIYYADQGSSRDAGLHSRFVHVLGTLIRPPNENSAALRNLALAISVGIIQAIPSMGLKLMFGLESYAIGIGGLLVVATIALVYYSHSLEPISFTAKLVGISLTGLLIFSGISGIDSIETARARQFAPLIAQFATIQQGVINNTSASIPAQPSSVAYWVSWPAPADYQLTDFQIHFLDEGTSVDSVLSVQGQGGSNQELAGGMPVRFVGANYTDFYRIRFVHDGRVYDVGFPWLAYAQPVLYEVNRYILMTVMGSIFVMVFFPFFFRHHLFNPLNSLLQGVRRADKDKDASTLPIFFEDEIGSLTRSFNQLMTSLRLSDKQKNEYYDDLTRANEEMEQRVVDRTSELSEANRLLLIARDEAAKTAVLEERHRLARDLHDAITQSLYGVMLFARASRDALEVDDQAKLHGNLEEIENSSLQTLKEMRLLLHELRPTSLEIGGLRGALNRRFDQVERRLGVSATVEMEADLGLPGRVEESVYLMASEALNNSLKHSNGGVVSVRLGRDNGTIQLVIEDQGDGFDPAGPHSGMGLSNMDERAKLLGGTLEVESEFGRGTSVCVEFPYPV